MKPEVKKAVLDQIQFEIESGYIYLQMEMWSESHTLPGIAKWMRNQRAEEETHARKFYTFLNDLGEDVTMQSIAAPRTEYSDALEMFTEALKHEQEVTRRIHALYELALEHNDYRLQSLLKWYIDEQVEEEQSFGEVVDTLKQLGTSGAGLIMLDRQLGRRGE